MKLKIKGGTVQISREDLPRIQNFNWYVSTLGYAVATIPRTGSKKIWMHKTILGSKEGYLTDHINRDRLDNRRKNLRFASIQENNRNTNCTGYYFQKGTNKWRVRIMKDKKLHHIGYFPTPDEAKNARKRAAKQLFGAFAPIN